MCKKNSKRAYRYTYVFFILFFGLKSRQNLLKCNGLIRQLLIVYILVAWIFSVRFHHFLTVAWAFFVTFGTQMYKRILWGFFSWNQGVARFWWLQQIFFWAKIAKNGHSGRVEWIIRQESKRVWFFFDRYFFVKEIVASFLLICLFFVAFTVKDFPIIKEQILIAYAILCRDLLLAICLRRCKPSWKKNIKNIKIKNNFHTILLV